MNRSLLKRATKDDPTPTQGWMYHSIIKMSNQSDSVARKVRDWLFRRMKTSSPHVKKKVLLVIKNICENGDANFAIHVSNKDGEIKELIHYRGKKDELHGDAINQGVRSTAKETMSAVYKRIETHQRAPKIPMVASPSRGGMGSDQITSNNRFVGLGSDGKSRVEEDIPTFPTAVDTGKYVGIPSSQVKCSKSKLKVSLGIANTCQCHKCRAERAEKRYGTGNGKSDVLVDNESSPSGYPENQSNQQYTFQHEYHPPELDSGTSYVGRKKVKENSKPPPALTEKRLVTKLCGGTQSSRISDEDMKKFVEGSFNVDGEIIASLLEENLENTNWKVRYKALTGICALLEDSNKTVTKYFRKSTSTLKECLSASQTPVQRKSAEVLRLLGVENVQIVEKKENVKSRPILSSSRNQNQSGGGGGGGGSLLSFMEDDNNNSTKKKEEEGGGEGFLDIFSQGEVVKETSMFESMEIVDETPEKKKKNELLNFFGEETMKAREPMKEPMDLGMTPLDNLVKVQENERVMKSKKMILENFSMDEIFSTTTKKTPSKTSPGILSPQQHKSPYLTTHQHQASPVLVQPPQQQQEVFMGLDDPDLLHIHPRTRMRVKKEKQMKPKKKEEDEFSKISNALLMQDDVFG